MNGDINNTLMALVPILKMNHENVEKIEAVQDWYKSGGREYMKEVAEITYENGHRIYADIGADSNLTAVYDVMAVIQGIKPRSSAIERVERGVYEMPFELYTKLCDEKPCPYINKCEKNGKILFCKQDDEKKEIRFIKGMMGAGVYSFKNVCRRDSIPKGGYSREKLKDFYRFVKYSFPGSAPPSIDVWIDELKEIGMYKEDVGEE